MRSYSQIVKDIAIPIEIKVDISYAISEQIQMPVAIVRKGIKQGLLTINGKPFHFHEIILKPNILIKFQNIQINTKKKESNNDFDRFIDEVKKELGIEDLQDVRAASKKPLCSYVVSFFSNNSYDKIANDSLHLNDVIHELESLYRDHFKNSNGTKIPRRKELVETLVKQRIECLRELTSLTQNLINGFFSNRSSNFYRNIQKL